MKEYNGKKVITMEDWYGSFDKIVSVGDYVDAEIISEMVNCLPPACMRSDCTQMGEHYSHREDPKTGKWLPTYSTFKKVDKGIWEYCGHCFRGENEERGTEPVYV